MSITTVPVSVAVYDNAGNPVAKAAIVAKLSQPEIHMGYVIPVEVATVADSDGNAVLNLWPNELGSTQSFYQVKITDPRSHKTLRLTATIPNRPCALYEVAEVPPYPGKTDGQLAVEQGIETVSDLVVAATNYAAATAESAGQATAAARAAHQSAMDAATAAAIADGRAGAATTQAGIATTQAGTATTQAGIATTQAGIATAKAGEAAASAGNAKTSETNAATSASTATAKAGEAATSAGNAKTSETNAATSAGTATTKAGEAATSAGNAKTSETNAATSAATATTKAGEAAASAGSAKTSETNAANSATLAQQTVALKQPLHKALETNAHSKRITIIGSSVPSGAGATNGNGYAQRLATALASKGYTVSNVSIGGEYTTLIINRFYRDVPPTRPDVVIIALSLANEGILTAGTAAKEAVYDQYITNMFKLADMCRQLGYKVLMTSAYPNGDYTAVEYQYIRQINQELENSSIPYINIGGAVDDYTGKWRAGMWSDPGHPNDIGHEAMFRAVPLSLFDRLPDGTDYIAPTPNGLHAVVIGQDANNAPLHYYPETPFGSVTVMANVRRPAGAASGRAIIAYTATGNTGGMCLRVRNALDVWGMSFDGVQATEVASPRLSSDNTRVNLAVRTDYFTNTHTLFVDGVKIGSLTQDIGTITAITFGGRVDNPASNAFGYEMDSMAVWRTGLTDEQIAEAANGRLSKGSLALYSPGVDKFVQKDSRLVNLAPSSTYLKVMTTDLGTSQRESHVQKSLEVTVPDTGIRTPLAKLAHVGYRSLNVIGQQSGGDLGPNPGILLDPSGGAIGIGAAGATPNLLLDLGGNVMVNKTTLSYAQAGRRNLEVDGPAAGSAIVGLSVAGSGKGYLYVDSTGRAEVAGLTALAFAINGSEQARFDSNGNLGIGTTTPGNKLEIRGTSPAMILRGTSNGEWRSVLFRNHIAGDVADYGSVGFMLGTGELRHAAGPNIANWGGFQTFFTDGAERARISGGNLMVNTTAVTANNSIRRYIAVKGNTGAGAIELQSGSTNVTGTMGVIQATDNGASGEKVVSAVRLAADGVTAVNLGGAIAFDTKADNGALTERARIDCNGNVGIGHNAPQSTLHVSKAGEPVLTVSNHQSSGLANAKAGSLVFRSSYGIASTYYDAARIDAITSAGSLDIAQMVFSVSKAGSGGVASEVARFDSYGNLLVGTSTLMNGSKLVVAGGITTTAQMNAMPGAGLNWELVNRNGAGFDFYTNVASILAARIESNGNFGVYAGGSIGSGNGYAGNTSAAANGVLKLYDPADGFTRLANGYITGGIILNTYNGSVRVDASGNLLAGVGNGSYHTIAKSGLVNNAGNAILEVRGSGSGIAVYATSGTYGSAANATLRVAVDTITNRSISASGTINASGADYAEYMTKAEGVGELAKGQIVGVDADGKLTARWADAVSFLIKSSDPSYVGGDVWGSESALGRARPVAPQLILPTYAGPADPGNAPDSPIAPELLTPIEPTAPVEPTQPVLLDLDEPVEPIAPADDAGDEAQADYLHALADYDEQLEAAEAARVSNASAQSAYQRAVESYQRLLEAYRLNLEGYRIALANNASAAEAYQLQLDEYHTQLGQHNEATAAYLLAQQNHAAACAAARHLFDTVTVPAYEAELADFEEVLEQARQRVDRMAYCGQVPCNVLGAKPGQYIVAVQDGEGIAGQLVDGDAITFPQYRRAVGIVQNILPDGRANVRVKPV